MSGVRYDFTLQVATLACPASTPEEVSCPPLEGTDGPVTDSISASVWARPWLPEGQRFQVRYQWGLDMLHCKRALAPTPPDHEAFYTALSKASLLPSYVKVQVTLAPVEDEAEVAPENEITQEVKAPAEDDNNVEEDLPTLE